MNEFGNWHITPPKGSDQPVPHEKTPDKKLATLCNYYLDCLNLDRSDGVSAPLMSSYELKYVELPGITIDGSEENTARLIHSVSFDRNLTAYVGYPVSIEKTNSPRSGQASFNVVPVFLFPVEISGGSCTISRNPHVNVKVIKQYSRNSDSQAHDLIALEDELGLNAPDFDVDLGDVVARLQTIRQWQYKEPLDPKTIQIDPPLNTITEEGIYNKAVFVITENSPYTARLEKELSLLAKISEDDYQNTALHDWLYGNTEQPSDLSVSDAPLLEVLPMNSEQEQAIRQALTNKLTIVTGPPGTGKSQVVANLIVNAASNKKNVLFTSKNNKAVDVVEERVNALGSRPIMLRGGSDQNARRLADLISDLLNYTTDKSDVEECKYYENLYLEKLSSYEDIKKKKKDTVNLRNHADRMEQRFCELREEWEPFFKTISEADASKCETLLKQYKTAHSDWYGTKTSFFGKLFWFLLKKKKTERLDSSLSELNGFLRKFNRKTFAENSESLTFSLYMKTSDEAKKTIRAIQTSCEYRRSLDDLMSEPPLEELDKQIVYLKSELARISKKLWNKRLLTQPLEINRLLKRKMREYEAAVRLVGGEDITKHKNIMRMFNNLQVEMATMLPCWAVTSLSANRAIPFTPGLFDLLIVDEASQCDIASVLPLLYRAKHVVIIGDPQQLSHISTIDKRRDMNLVDQYNVSPCWAYSVNSLYDVSNGLVDSEQTVHLRDHHRSFAEIIDFSNNEFYHGNLRVATNYDRLCIPQDVAPGVHWIDVSGKTVRPTHGSAYNDAEVKEVLKELKYLITDIKYTGTIGIVTPFTAQAERIRRAIRNDSLLCNAFFQNDLLVDTVHKFQGDERDLILFSPVVSQGTTDGTIRFLKNTPKLFNVAITRARAVLVVVGDSGYCSTCGVSYLEKFVQHVSRMKTQKTAEPSEDICLGDGAYPHVSNPEQVSDWERIFYTELFNQGIQTIPQYSAEKYKLDLALIKGDRMLDIEIDGELYHKDWNGELSYRDQLRNQRLFELGWDVKRFWVYQIRDDLQSCIDQVKEWYET